MTWAEPVNLTSIKGLFVYADEVSEGSFIIGIPITLFAVIFLYFKSKDYRTSDCLITAGFITLIASSFLRLAGLIDNTALFWVVSITILAAVWGFMKNRD